MDWVLVENDYIYNATLGISKFVDVNRSHPDLHLSLNYFPTKTNIRGTRRLAGD